MEDPGPHPGALVLVMGATGAGKTTFVNEASGSDLEVGHDLDSCTSEVQVAPHFELDGRVVTLVDSPGFDDTERSEAEILQEVAEFLEQTYKYQCLLSGIIFLYNIGEVRFGGVARHNLDLFYSLCGESTLRNVILVTNMWSSNSGDSQRQAQRETQLARKFFKTALDNGAQMCRHDGSPESAHSIVRRILQNEPRALRLQEELVNGGMRLAETGAGTLLRDNFDELSEYIRDEIADLTVQICQQEVELQRARGAEDRRVESERLRENLIGTRSMIDELKTNLEKHAQHKNQLFEKENKFRLKIWKKIQDAFSKAREFALKRFMWGSPRRITPATATNHQ